MSDHQVRARLYIRATPRARKDEIVARSGDDLLVSVTAPPDDGKANAAVCKLIAKSLGVPKSAVEVSRGHTSRHKALDIEGVTQEHVSAWRDSFPEK